MRLKNKKTGAIYKIEDIDLGNNADGIWLGMTKYNSLTELNEDWEDYEEPKVGYIVDPMEEDCVSADDSGYEEPDVERAKELGIWFEAKEEAEKAVEKLKAWKRLKDKGFKFNRWTIPEEPKAPHIKLVIEAEMDVPDSPYDLDLLFSQEDD